MVERLGMPREYIDWSIIPEYRNHTWDGTPNPLMALLKAITGPSDKNWAAVESATSTGKTVLLAGIVLWFLECHENSLVVTTAPKEDQLTFHVWRWINVFFRKFKRGRLTKLLLRMQEDSEDWLATGFVAGVEADEELNRKAQGFHAQHMLIILEETPGIPQQIITSLTNTSTAEHNIILAVGNPDNELDNLHQLTKKSRVNHIIISALDHPNIVTGNNNFIPGAQTVIGLAGLLETYNNDPEHPLYKSRARGICPTGSADSLIKMEWVKKAIDKFASRRVNGKIDLNEIEGEFAIGLDVANSEAGDEAAKCKGKGFVCYDIQSFPCPNSNKLGKRVAREMEEEGIEKIQVDGVGVGAGTVNQMLEYGFTNDINFQSAAKPLVIPWMKEQFKNIRSQAWWFTREMFRREELEMPNDPELIRELTAPKWEEEKDLIVVESKPDIKKRIGNSPNKADSFVMWVWNHVKDRLRYFYMLKAEIHDTEEIPAGKILCGIKYGDVSAAYFGVMKSDGQIHVFDEWHVNELDKQLEEKALLFANFCKDNEYKGIKVVCHSEMWNYPVRAEGGSKPVVETFLKYTKSAKLGIEFIKAAETKSTVKPYEEYMNEIVKNLLNYKIDPDTNLWVRQPMCLISVRRCPEFWKHVPKLKMDGKKLEPSGVYDAFRTLVTSFEKPEAKVDPDELLNLLKEQNKDNFF